MPAKTRNCSNCGGVAFNVLEDGHLVCESCGTETAPPVSDTPPRTYNRAVKHQSGSGDSLWNGLATFLLFEHATGGCIGMACLLMVLIFGGGAIYWFSGRERPPRKPPEVKRKSPPEMTDEQKQTRTLQLVSMAADKVQKESRSTGRVLHKDEAHRAMTPRTDAWGSLLIYELVDEHTLRIRSSGKDKQPETDDDIIETRDIRRPDLTLKKTTAS